VGWFRVRRIGVGDHVVGPDRILRIEQHARQFVKTQNLVVEKRHHPLHLIGAEHLGDPAGKDHGIEVFQMEFDVIGMMTGDFVEHKEDRQLHQHPRRRVTLLIEDIFGRIEVTEEFVNVFVVSGGVDKRFTRFVHTEFFEH